MIQSETMAMGMVSVRATVATVGLVSSTARAHSKSLMTLSMKPFRICAERRCVKPYCEHFWKHWSAAGGVSCIVPRSQGWTK